MGVTSICLSLFLHVYADAAILTALITLTSGLIGSLTSLLVNTRTQSQEPPKVEIAQPPDKPVPVAETDTKL